MANTIHPNRERMEELCNLAALGELPLSETRELGEHIRWCSECRTLLTDFAQLALHELPLLAASRVDDQADLLLEDADVERALTRVLGKAKRNPKELPLRTLDRIPRANRSARLNLGRAGAFACGFAALLLAVGGAFGYHFYAALARQTQATTNHLLAENKLWRDRAESLLVQQHSTQLSLDQARAEAADKAFQVQHEQSTNATLEDSQQTIAARLTDTTAALSNQSDEIQKLQASLDFERKNGRAASEQAQQLESRLKDAQGMLAELSRDKVLSQAEPPVTSADARELFGARDLHIVDIFDMKTSNGARKLHGRVYYVDRRLLLFYAFDLPDLKNTRAPAGFQAWGFRQPNSAQPESLGMFYLDDATVNRWALEVKNPALLARIDTVFVTAEVPGGSQSPKGRKLLFASLAGPPNHP